MSQAADTASAEMGKTTEKTLSTDELQEKVKKDLSITGEMLAGD